MKKLILIIFFFIPVIFSGCSIKKTVVKASHPVIRNIETAFLTEKDIAFAGDALPGLIKLAEGIYETEPGSYFYAAKLSFLYAAYTLAYIDKTPFDEFDQNKQEKEKRISFFYSRAKDYAIKALSIKHKNFKNDLFDNNKIDNSLQSISSKEIDALFWLCFSWSLEIFSNIAEPQRLAELPIIEKIIKRIIEIDDSYFYGSVYTVYSAFWGARADMIGGNAEKSLEYYKRAIEINNNLSVIPQYVRLRYVSIILEDPEEFETLYREIKQFNADSNPQLILINTLLKEKAENIMTQKEQYFF